ncbi:MAG: hypothetical protein MUE75_15810 [Algoriphagus sp.]|jgi:hypothetical protein|nr:hypothetical protein [Algoriphagus sp.]
MKEIEQTIDLNTNSKTKKLSFVIRYLVQDSFTFDLSVFSDGFSGTSYFCVRRDQLEKLCHDLKKMYMTLSDSVMLEDNDSDGFVQFEMNSTGHLYVSGQIGGTHSEQLVRFKFQTDQTCIPQFAKDFELLLKSEGN